jgi:calcium/proton exchanger cax
MKYLSLLLIFAPVAILGLFDLVKASIAGSIIGEILLVMGLSVLFGGIKNGTQRFGRTQAGANPVQLSLSVPALMFPSLFFPHPENTSSVGYLSSRVSGACRRSTDLARERSAPTTWPLKPPFLLCRAKSCPKL